MDLMSYLNLNACVCFFPSQRGEIICYLADLLTEKKDEILNANKADMELASASGTQLQSTYTATSSSDSNRTLVAPWLR